MAAAEYKVLHSEDFEQDVETEDRNPEPSVRPEDAPEQEGLDLTGETCKDLVRHRLDHLARFGISALRDFWFFYREVREEHKFSGDTPDKISIRVRGHCLHP